MAQAVYSLRIFATGGLSPGAGVVGPVVPSGLVYVLRDVDANEITGVAGTFMNVLNQTTGPLVEFGFATAVPIRNQSWRGRQVYNPGEQVGFQAGAGTWSIAASGYQLTLP